MDLSIIILSYNTKDITISCLQSIINSFKQGNKVTKQQATINYEIIVVDNGSTDNSQAQISRLRQDYGEQVKLKVIFNTENRGFARANNQAARQAKGKYILFLNSDIIVQKVDFKDLINYLEKHENVGVLTVKIKLEDDTIDPASHRGFPTLWRSFCYFTKLEKIFGHLPYLSKIFGGYHLLDNNFNQEHEIDSPSGAFFLVRKEILDKLKGFDEKFFMYGEDLDLSFRIKRLGYKVVYQPQWTVKHLKYQSGLQHSDEKIKRSIEKHFYQAMKIFYDKHYSSKYHPMVNRAVHLLINLKEKLS